MTDDADSFDALARLLEDPSYTDDVLSRLLMADDGAQPLTSSESGTASPDGDSMGSSSQASPHSTETVKQRKKKRQPGYNSNKARDGRRLEIMQLKETVAHLEELAAQLQQQKAKRGVVNTDELGLHHAISVWETIAMRQLAERRRSEEENSRLKIALDDQVRLTKSLERLLTRPSTTQGFELNGISVPRSKYLARRRDPTTYDELYRDTESGCRAIDSLFQRLGIRDMEHSFRDMKLIQDTRGGMQLEIFQNEVLPLKAELAGDFVWRRCSECMYRIPFRLYYDRIHEGGDRDQDLTLERMEMKFESDVAADVSSMQVMRRYNEDGRVAIVWSATLLPQTFAGQEVEGLRFLERGSILVEQPKTLDAETHSIFKMYISFSPFLADNATPLDPALVKRVTEFIYANGATMASKLHQELENLLIQELLMLPQRK
ncbi:hypothetical protein Poli38472_000505 [Pythium oligandrum]|uniref:Uncharacterized protein n=1 Tax=Pythium oligandrum TaxID=41045 RepID=A0A8K1FJ73_PYTOL|nr:hypothetical protein Poli38472_000505 [Pythium oligandrum]|eukprot:TMW60463.1 hypothetical protein Poli38472_000505 [Pythium oligandrum]